MRELKLVLYVEDDPDIQMVAQMALEVVGGLKLRSCTSGQEALDAATTCQPDLILLDVMMPGLDGPATLAQLRKLPNTASTPVVFMTAKVQTAEVAYYKTLGALGVIAKPFDPMQLAQAVRHPHDISEIGLALAALQSEQ
jgi:two-component system OmpR family response regulator